METIKKIVKEMGIFILVAVIVLILAGYRQLNPTTYKHVTESKVTSMIESNKDFVLVVGMDSYDKEKDSDKTDYTGATTEQNVYINAYIKQNHEKVYYLSESDIKDVKAFMEKVGSTSEELPQTFFFIDGEVYRSKTGTVKSYDFSKMVDDWKKQK